MCERVRKPIKCTKVNNLKFFCDIRRALFIARQSPFHIKIKKSKNQKSIARQMFTKYTQCGDRNKAEEKYRTSTTEFSERKSTSVQYLIQRF